jgi:hypothetical protein
MTVLTYHEHKHCGLSEEIIIINIIIIILLLLLLLLLLPEEVAQYVWQLRNGLNEGRTEVRLRAEA